MYRDVEIDPNVEPRIIKILVEQDPTARDRNFLESLLKGVKKWGKLTAPQQRAFDRLEYRYSEEGRKALTTWTKKYNEELREDTMIAAKYYSYRAKCLPSLAYFSNVADRIIDDPDFIPTMHTYQKMVLNRYAQQIIEQTKSRPLYEEGDCVMLRGSQENATMERAFTNGKGERVWKKYPMGHRFIVVDNNLPKVNARKGGRVYKVLPFAEANVLEVEERSIKKCRGL